MIRGPPWYREQVSLDDVGDASDPQIITCTPEPADGVGNTLPDHVVSALSDVDITIRFGFGILKGPALTAPTYGVLSYHHGDISEYRGRPAGFYEFIHGAATAGVTIQQLSEELDKGTVAATTKCDIEDANSLRDVQSRQFDASIPLLTEAVDHLITGPLPEQPETYGTLYYTPDGSSAIRYCRRRTTKAVHSLLSRLFRK